MIYLTMPLNLKDNILGYLAGSPIVFVILGVLVVSLLSAKWRIPAIGFGMILMMFIIIFYSVQELNGAMLALMVIMIGGVSIWIIRVLMRLMG